MKLRYAMVCSSNQNRSMEAHSLMKRQGFDVSSYGTGGHVKLPGPSLREPNVYDFGTPYKQMYDELRRKDPDLYPSLFLLFLPPVLVLHSFLVYWSRRRACCAPVKWRRGPSEDESGGSDVVNPAVSPELCGIQIQTQRHPSDAQAKFGHQTCPSEVAGQLGRRRL